MKTIKLYTKLARIIEWQKRNAGNNVPAEIAERQDCAFDEIMDSAPSGSGIDCGTKFISYKNGKLKFQADFHHMNDGGFYDGWTEHVVTVSPCLAYGYEIKISGRDRNQIKDYLHDVYHHWLNADVAEY